MDKPAFFPTFTLLLRLVPNFTSNPPLRVPHEQRCTVRGWPDHLLNRLKHASGYWHSFLSALCPSYHLIRSFRCLSKAPFPYAPVFPDFSFIAASYYRSFRFPFLFRYKFARQRQPSQIISRARGVRLPGYRSGRHRNGGGGGGKYKIIVIFRNLEFQLGACKLFDNAPNIAI